MMLTIRARYFEKPYKGIIRVVTLVGQSPIEFKMILFHETHGEIIVKTSTFFSINDAITHSRDYGFMPHLWVLEQIEKT